MDLLSLSAPASAAQPGPREIRSLRPNVTQAQAEHALGGRAGPWRGPLHRIAAAYLPFRLYEVAITNRGATRIRLFAADAVSGQLDLYEFPAAPLPGELLTVVTRNCPCERLLETQALALLEDKVRRAVFQGGFFGVRGLAIRPRPLHIELHVPYWLGFFGRTQRRATLEVMDAVRRQFEGAKARAVFGDWLSETA